MEISKKAAQAIVYAINFHLEDAGLLEVKAARLMAIGLADTVRQIMLDEINLNFTNEKTTIEKENLQSFVVFQPREG